MVSKDEKFLVIGHPRSGTGYAANLLSSADYKVGHEKLLENGISSWQWATEAKVVPWGDAPTREQFDTTIMIVRHPLQCIASVAYTENVSFNWRSKFAALNPEEHPFVNAMLSIFQWNAMCRGKVPDYIVKTENLYEFLKYELKIPVLDIPAQNKRKHPPLHADGVKGKLFDSLLHQWETAI